MLFIIIQQVDHPVEHLAGLVRPARPVPLASGFTKAERVLLKIILIRRFIGSKPKFAQ